MACPSGPGLAQAGRVTTGQPFTCAFFGMLLVASRLDPPARTIMADWLAVATADATYCSCCWCCLLARLPLCLQGIQDMLIQYLQLVVGFNTADQGLLFTLIGAANLLVQVCDGRSPVLCYIYLASVTLTMAVSPTLFPARARCNTHAAWCQNHPSFSMCFATRTCRVPSAFATCWPEGLLAKQCCHCTLSLLRCPCSMPAGCLPALDGVSPGGAPPADCGPGVLNH